MLTYYSLQMNAFTHTKKVHHGIKHSDFDNTQHR
jgi:hypothetical protein